MRTMLQVCLAGTLLVRALAGAEAAAVEGTWEAALDGVKALTLQIHAANGKLGGHAIFYVVDKESTDPEKRIIGQDDRPLVDVRWDGKVVRFSVTRTADQPEAVTVSFEMTLSGPNAATLKRLAGNGNPELSVTLQRHP